MLENCCWFFSKVVDPIKFLVHSSTSHLWLFIDFTNSAQVLHLRVVFGFQMKSSRVTYIYAKQRHPSLHSECLHYLEVFSGHYLSSYIALK